MAFAERKRNRLAGYNYSQPGAYFITVCTKNKMPILGTVVGAGDHTGPNLVRTVGTDACSGPYTRLSAIGLVVEKYTRSIPGIGSFVIMPNHVHMILHISAKDPSGGPMWASAPTEASVEKLICSWKILISKEVGQSIWQRSYYDHIIRDGKDYQIRVQYISENPAKWYFDDYYAR